MKIRIWCEFTPPKEVCRDYILRCFKNNNVVLNYKLEYGSAGEDFFDMLRTYNDWEIPVSIWATLSDKMGCWINERNAAYFDRYVRRLTGMLEKRSLDVEGFCIDMEPPHTDVQRMWNPKTMLGPIITGAKMLTQNLNKKRFAEAQKILGGTAEFLRQKGLESYATCARHCYYDLRFNMEFMQNALEIPVFSIDWDKYNVMYYATMIRNEMKRFRRVNVDYLIFHQVKHLKEKLKDKLAVSVGVTNVGKLGNEPYYESMEEFSKDIGILKECGVEDFSLFSLDGILEEEKLTGYIEAINEARPYKPRYCRRVIRNEALAEGLMKLADVYYRVFR